MAVHRPFGEKNERCFVIFSMSEKVGRTLSFELNIFCIDLIGTIENYRVLKIRDRSSMILWYLRSEFYTEIKMII